MYKIAICEDNSEDITYLKKMIEATDVLDKNDLQIYDFSSGEEIFLSNWISYDLVIIDMQLGVGKMSGYETAQKLREIDNDFLLVFCSGSVRPFSDSYKANPYRYLEKGIADDTMADELRAIMAEVKRRKAMPGVLCRLSIKEKIMVYPREILYIVKGRRGSWVHITGEMAEQYVSPALKCDMKLEEINNIFNEASGFTRPHSSYIVNMSYIEAVSDNTLLLANKERIKCSRSKIKEFDLAFTAYMSAKYTRK